MCGEYGLYLCARGVAVFVRRNEREKCLCERLLLHNTYDDVSCGRLASRPVDHVEQTMLPLVAKSLQVTNFVLKKSICTKKLEMDNEPLEWRCAPRGAVARR